MRADHAHWNWQALFAGLERSGAGLKAQIRQMLVQAIERRVLLPGARLPSGRQLAAMLGVARITVTEVYQDLVGEGYLVARERSGIFVAPPDANCASQAGPPPRAAHGDWQSRFVIDANKEKNYHKPDDWRRYRYPFLFGELDPALFPVAEWRKSVQEASSGRAIRDWSVDMIDGDDPALIEQLCLQVLPRRSIWAAPEEVMITAGAQ
nr:GntR family transcriptional regulator [uncultured Acidocella sp.]